MTALQQLWCPAHASSETGGWLPNQQGCCGGQGGVEAAFTTQGLAPTAHPPRACRHLLRSVARNNTVIMAISNDNHRLATAARHMCLHLWSWQPPKGGWQGRGALPINRPASLAAACRDFVTNWVHHLRRAGLDNFVIGALTQPRTL